MTHLSQSGGLTDSVAMNGGGAGNFNKLQDHESEIVYNSGAHNFGGGDH